MATMNPPYAQCQAKVWRTVRYTGLSRWLPTGDERGCLTERISGRCKRRADAHGYCWQHRGERDAER